MNYYQQLRWNDLYSSKINNIFWTYWKRSRVCERTINLTTPRKPYNKEQTLLPLCNILRIVVVVVNWLDEVEKFAISWERWRRYSFSMKRFACYWILVRSVVRAINCQAICYTFILIQFYLWKISLMSTVNIIFECWGIISGEFKFWE